MTLRTIRMIITDSAVQYSHTVLMRLRYLEPYMLIRVVTSITAQNMRTVCQALGAQPSRHSEIADKISWPPEKLIEVVTVQLPTSVSQPVVHELIGAHFGEDSIALH